MVGMVRVVISGLWIEEMARVVVGEKCDGAV